MAGKISAYLIYSKELELNKFFGEKMREIEELIGDS